MQTNFKNTLSSVTNSDNNLQLSENNEDISPIIKNYRNYYGTIFTNSQIREHLHYIVADILLEYEKNFPDSKIQSYYRVKSENSTKNKIKQHISKYKTSLINNPDTNLDEITDLFAMKIIPTSNHTNFSLADIYDLDSKTYNKLKTILDETDANREYLKESKAFRQKLIYSNDYKCSRKDYYLKCKEIIKRIKSMIDPKAKKLLKTYNQQIAYIDKILKKLDSISPEEKEKPVNLNIINDPYMNFFNLLDDFSKRLYDKLDLAVITENISSLLKKSDILSNLGITFDGNIEEKRTPAGYVSNVLIFRIKVPSKDGKLIDIPLECQLQSEHEYKEGVDGYASHGKMPGKTIPYYDFPDLDDPVQIAKYKKSVHSILPENYIACLDITKKGCVLVINIDDMQNYKHLLSENGDDYYRLSYIEYMSINADKLFDSQNKSKSIFDYELANYMEKFKNGGVKFDISLSSDKELPSR